jgi:hypothetical protein
VDDLGMAALRGAAAAVCKPFKPAELAEAFDFTGSLTFPIETFVKGHSIAADGENCSHISFDWVRCRESIA